MQKRLNGALFRFATLISFAAAAYAQTGSIAGTILDASGAGVPGATVKATNLATSAVRTAVTDTAGTYLIPNVAVGTYDVSVEKQGFSALTFRNISLTVAQNLTLNGSLQVGATTQSVEVAGTSIAPINLEDAQISNVVDSTHILDLPLITRDPYQLVLLSPGSQMVNSSLGGFSINGQRERNNNFLLDGTDNNDASVPGGPGGITSINPDATQEFRVITNNFLPEFGRNTGAIVDIVTRSGTNQFHGDVYEFNRVSAMAARDWFNPSAGENGGPQNPFVRNQFGGSFGGPIIKNKTFFFVNSEWDRFQTTLTNEAIVPTPAFKSGIFTYDGQQINLANPASPNNALGLPLDPTMQKIFALYPNPNGPLVNSLEGAYFFPEAIPDNSNETVFRLDHHFSDKYTLSLRYIYNGLTQGDELNEFLPGLGGVDTAEQGHNGSLGFIAALRPNLVDELRFGLTRQDYVFTCTGINTLNQYSTPDAFGFGTDYSFNLYTGVSTISNFGCGPLGDSDGQARTAGTWHFADSLSWTKGRHNFKFGGEFRYVYDNGYDGFYSRPTVDFTAYGNFQIPIVNCAGACASDQVLQTLAAALLGVPGIQSQTQFYNAQGTRTPLDFRDFVQHEYAGFAQDSWKVRSNLTIELGLRYEFEGVPFERSGNFSNLLYQQASATAPITFSTVGPGTGRQMYANDPYDFEPRVGLAWDPFKDGKTSVRMGYGIFHDRVFGNLFEDLRGNPPFVALVDNYPNLNFANRATATPVTLATLPPLATQPSPSASIPDQSYLSGIYLIDPKLKTPYTQSWNVGVQRDLGHGMTLEVNYVGSSSHRQFRVVDANPPIPALVAAAQANGSLPASVSGEDLFYAPLEGFPQVTGNLAFVEPGLVESVGNATYEGLQSVFHKRLSNGLDFQAAYTYSHAIDDSNDPLAAPGGNRTFARDSFDLHEDRGNSSYDLRHRLVLNFIYQLPLGTGHKYFDHGAAARVFGGWELSGLSTFQSGHPMDLYSAVDSQYTGLTSRPDLVGNPAIPAGAPRNEVGPPITAFANPPYGRAGDVSRNMFTGPTYYNTDVSLLKTTRIRERMNLQFRAEVYNVFNRIQFDQLGAASDTMASPGTFGLALDTLTQPDTTTSARQIQLALKLMF